MKFQCEDALLRSRAGQDALPILDYSSPTILKEMEENYELALAKTENIVLVQLLLLGQYYARHSHKLVPDQRPHRVGVFLWNYFQYEPEALPHLSGVTVASIDRVPPKDHDEIIRQRPPKPPPAPSPASDYEDPFLRPPKRTRRKSPSKTLSPDILGQNGISPGEMWQTDPNSPTSPHYSPVPFDDDFYLEGLKSPPLLSLPLPLPLSPPPSVAVPRPLQFGRRSGK